MNENMETAAALASGLTAFSTALLAWIAWYQLGALRTQLQVEGDRERQWRTIEACERYTYDEVLKGCKARLYEARGRGQLSVFPDVSAVKHDALTLVNYLDAVGLGVRQGVYIEEIVKTYLGVITLSVVENFVKNGYGQFGINEGHVRGLMHLYQRFLPDGSPHSVV